jgi:hypothetical protein
MSTRFSVFDSSWLGERTWTALWSGVELMSRRVVDLDRRLEWLSFGLTDDVWRLGAVTGRTRWGSLASVVGRNIVSELRRLLIDFGGGCEWVERVVGIVKREGYG